MPDKYKYFASTATDTRQVFPLGKPKISWEKKDDDYRHDYTVKITENIIFTGNDFNWFLTLENSPSRCEFVNLTIDKDCNGVIIQGWAKGRISMNAGKWDLDKCVVSFTIDTADKFACYDDNKDVEINLFNYVAASKVVRLMSGIVEYNSCFVPPDATCPDEADGWVLYRYYDASAGTGNPHIEKYYARYNDNGVIKPAIVYDPFTIAPAADTTNTTYKIAGINSSGQIDNGLPLKECFQALLDIVCNGLTIKSDFFQWNPENGTTINYVTGEESKILNLVLYQKSDVKRPDLYSSASVANVKLPDLLQNICTMFNLRWDIDEAEKLQSALAEVASLTGGWTAFLEKPDDADAIYSRIFTDINQRYIVGY